MKPVHQSTSQLVNQLTSSLFLIFILLLFSCNKQDGNGTIDPTDSLDFKPPYELAEFVMGVDLSYVNEILDQGGQYGTLHDPYKGFEEIGANVVRLRLWNNPAWLRDYYTEEVPMYSGLDDVIRAAERVEALGMEWCLDFHYSDNWADPEKQRKPQAWKDLSFESLVDSVRLFTEASLNKIKAKGLQPAFVQVGNEINSGLLHPDGHAGDGNWEQVGSLINAGIEGVRMVFPDIDETKIIIHIAQPENVRWFFNNITISGQVANFEVIGFSYYSKWSTVPIDEISGYVRTMIKDFGKEVQIMETAFPWTQNGADNYSNIMGGIDSLGGFPVSKQGQLEFMTRLCQEVIDGGGSGVHYWEPAWISAPINTQWGTGSAWENCSFFDFENNNSWLPVINYITHQYQFKQ